MYSTINGAVVAIDFRATCSGAAACLIIENDIPSNIITIGKLNFPAIIFYNQNLEVTHWGSPMAQLLYWIAWRPQGEYKVELSKLRSMQCTNTSTLEISSPPPGKLDSDVMADYFFNPYHRLQTEVQQAFGVELNKENRIRFVICLPDDFTQAAKNAIHEAGNRAFSVDGEKGNLDIISESQAATVYATRNSSQASIGDMLLVVNCGACHRLECPWNSTNEPIPEV